MEPEFWLSRWREGRIGFHEDDVNPCLTKHWGRLDLAADAPVWVPMCGKSHDMQWLADRGHSVLGVELSEIAIREFFEERDVECRVREENGFGVFESDRVTLLQGDLFELGPKDLAKIRAVYDRGALVALPEARRRDYARHFARVLAPGTQVLLVTLEYDTERMSGPPFSITDEEVRSLFGDAFEVSLLGEESGPHAVGRLAGRGLESLREAVHSLRRK